MPFVTCIRSCEEPLINRAHMEKVVQESRIPDGTVIGVRGLYAILVIVKWLNHASRKVGETRADVMNALP